MLIEHSRPDRLDRADPRRDRHRQGTGRPRRSTTRAPRATMPFVAINCGALPETLIESELFGHRKGAFTGADDHRVGLFEVANGGTIFLDEIGELPKAMQAKLLRVLESGEIRRVGENKPLIVDVRVVCATHRNLPEMVADGRLPRRLDVPHQHVRDHAAAAPRADRRRAGTGRHLLVRHRRGKDADDAASAARRDHRPLQRTSGPATSANWRTSSSTPRSSATAARSAASICRRGSTRRATRRRQPARQPGVMTLRELEMEAIHDALERHAGNKPKAADELGISLKTLYNKLNQAGDLEKSA